MIALLLVNLLSANYHEESLTPSAFLPLHPLLLATPWIARSSLVHLQSTDTIPATSRHVVKARLLSEGRVQHTQRLR